MKLKTSVIIKNEILRPEVIYNVIVPVFKDVYYKVL